MKFEEYLHDKKFLHDLPKLPKRIDQFEHMLLYGPAGAGKYTQMLRIVNTYSKSHLKYERRVSVPTSLQQPHMIKISDIHYEVNMELLGCNAKVLWHDIFTHIMEMIQNKFPDKTGIIVCTNFHSIHNELLEIFYSYMQASVKFILLSEAVSFIPSTVVDRCKLVRVPKPDVAKVKECFGLETVYLSTNLACVHAACPSMEQVASENIARDIGRVGIVEIREHLYHILIHNINAELCMWHIWKLTVPSLDPEKVPALLVQWCESMLLYTRNYRPLFHLEHFVMLLTCAVQSAKGQERLGSL
jgi:hypothetical protein